MNITDHLVEAAARAANLEAGRQRGLTFEDDWGTLTEQERGGWRLLMRRALEAVQEEEGEPTNILSWREYVGEIHGQLQEIVNELGEELKKEEK